MKNIAFIPIDEGLENNQCSSVENSISSFYQHLPKEKEPARTY